MGAPFSMMNATRTPSHKEADTAEDCAARAFRHVSAENELLTRTGCLDRLGRVR